MPSNEQRRKAAKRKLERQLVRRAARTRRNRIVAVTATVVVVLLAVGGIYLLAAGGDDNDQANAADDTQEPTPTESPGEPTEGPCEYLVQPDAEPAKEVDPPPDPDPTPADGTVDVVLKTSAGDIPVTLDRAKAPCTVQSIEHLMTSEYYDETPCHRLVHADNFRVLQCGDPTGQGTGGPGYTIPDEPPTGLETATAEEAQGASIYPRGAIAMAKAQAPDTGGSQFFMVYGDTYLSPDYTIFGTISEDGLKVLDKIGEAGHADGVDPEVGDGAPAEEVIITEAAVVE